MLPLQENDNTSSTSSSLPSRPPNEVNGQIVNTAHTYEWVSNHRHRCHSVFDDQDSHESSSYNDDEESHLMDSTTTPPVLANLHTTSRSTWAYPIVGLGCTACTYIIYPTPSTVPVFIGSAISLCCWVLVTWAGIIISLSRPWQHPNSYGNSHHHHQKTPQRILRNNRTARCSKRCVVATALVVWWAIISMPTSTPSKEVPPVMIGNGEKYFIAVNLSKNEDIMVNFIAELTSLVFHRESLCQLSKEG